MNEKKKNRIIENVRRVLEERELGRSSWPAIQLAEYVLDALLDLDLAEASAETRTREALAMIDEMGTAQKRIEAALVLCRAEIERNKSMHSTATDGFAFQVALALTGGKL